jgi:hypothetical protein
MRGQFPQRPSQHACGDAGRSLVEYVLDTWGWTAEEVRRDYGEDLDCTIFLDGQRTHLYFRCQVKSSLADKGIRRLKNGDFSVRVKGSTCRSWLLGYFPVILVVCDLGTERMYWINATRYLRLNPALLSKFQVTFRVSRLLDLRESKDMLIDEIRGFYGTLLRVTSPELVCEVLPVLMPGFRGIPPDDHYAMDAVFQPPEGVTLELYKLVRKRLPAWAASIKTLQPPYLCGWLATLAEQRARDFTQALRQLAERLPTVPSKPDGWVSLVCAPVRFRRPAESANGLIWGGQLTDWFSYANVCGRVRADTNYAFGLPPGFARPSFHVNTWAEHRFCYLDQRRDLALELRACEPVTPADADHLQTHRQHTYGQFVPWTCSTDQVPELLSALRNAGLNYMELSKSSDGHASQGAICTPFFIPGRAYEPAESWAEFEEGRVRRSLRLAESLGSLPGQEWSADIAAGLLGVVGPDSPPPETILVDEIEHVEGMPLDHSARLIRVSRLRESGCLKEGARDVLAQCEEQISLCSEDPEGVRAEVSKLSVLASSIKELSVQWVPSLCETSAESFERHASAVIEAFNAILPIGSGVSGLFENTETTLEAVWGLHFPQHIWPT